MRSLKRLCEILLGLLIFRFGFYVLVVGWSRTDSFFVENAQLADPSLLHRERARIAAGEKVEYNELIHRVTAHRIESGKGVVLGYRWYSPGSPLNIDDESYKKITVWLPENYINSSGKVDIVDASGVIIIYSKGASAWPRTIGCHGEVGTGVLNLEWGDNHVRAAVEGTIDYVPNVVHKKLECKPKVLSEKLKFSPMRLDDLTPWHGVAGEHIYSETYR